MLSLSSKTFRSFSSQLLARSQSTLVIIFINNIISYFSTQFYQVLVEHNNSELSPTTLHAVTAATQVGGEVCAFILCGSQSPF